MAGKISGAAPNAFARAASITRKSAAPAHAADTAKAHAAPHAAVHGPRSSQSAAASTPVADARSSASLVSGSGQQTPVEPAMPASAAERTRGVGKRSDECDDLKPVTASPERVAKAFTDAGFASRNTAPPTPAPTVATSSSGLDDVIIGATGRGGGGSVVDPSDDDQSGDDGPFGTPAGSITGIDMLDDIIIGATGRGGGGSAPDPKDVHDDDIGGATGRGGHGHIPGAPRATTPVGQHSVS